MRGCADQLGWVRFVDTIQFATKINKTWTLDVHRTMACGGGASRRDRARIGIGGRGGYLDVCSDV